MEDQVSSIYSGLAKNKHWKQAQIWTQILTKLLLTAAAHTQ